MMGIVAQAVINKGRIHATNRAFFFMVSLYHTAAWARQPGGDFVIGHLTQWILDALRTNGGWSVFIGVLIEQIIIPIPSPAIIMGAGFILIPGETSWADAIAIPE